MGIVAIAEIVVALFLSKKVFQRNGKPAHLNQIAKAFEIVFNCNFRSIYDQQEQINTLHQLQKKDNAKLLKLISLYSDLATCGVMDGKRRENLKAEIIDPINEK